MTNKVEVDHRRFVYSVAMNGVGLDIHRLTGKTLLAAYPNERNPDGGDE
jgi:hypothetical protein